MTSAEHIAEKEALKAENAELKAAVNALRHEIAQIKRMLFGTKSERFEAGSGGDQLPLFEGITVEPTPEPEKQTIERTVPRRKPVRGALPGHLPREEFVIQPDFVPEGMEQIGEEVWR
jgi:transposase